MKTSIGWLDVANHSYPANKARYTSKTSRDVQFIVIHYTANKKDTAVANAKYFQSVPEPKKNASAHLFVDETSFYQSVQIKDIAYHVGANSYKHKTCRNTNSVGIEMCTSGNYKVSQTTINRTAGLVAYLFITFGWTVNEVDTRVLRHWDVTGKLCPAQMVGDKNVEWLAFKDLVRQKILAATNPSASAPAQTPPTTPKIDYSPVFNASFYRSKYADLSSKTDAELLQHFEMFGMNEFRQASKNFNPTVYKAKNSDLQPFIEMTFKKEEWNMQYYLHYINYGRNEGRVSC